MVQRKFEFIVLRNGVNLNDAPLVCVHSRLDYVDRCFLLKLRQVMQSGTDGSMDGWMGGWVDGCRWIDGDELRR